MTKATPDPWTSGLRSRLTNVEKGVFRTSKSSNSFSLFSHMAAESRQPKQLPRGGGSSLLQRSCHDCNRRKVRCNKESPCDNCVRLGIECTFPPPGRKPREKPIKKQSQKSHLLSRLSLLEQEVQKLGGQSQPRAPSTDQIEQEYRSQDPQIGWILPSWLAGNLEPDQSTKLDEHDSEPRGKTKSPQDNSATLSDEFGRLVLDRNSGTSRYVNHRVLTGLADQVYHTLNGARSIVDSFKQACSAYINIPNKGERHSGLI